MQPAWAPPRSPLPPSRLAKIANALGVATPVPNTDAPSKSKFLLHVVPPIHLQTDPDCPPPPPTASGYHTHFRRGTLVALQSTLHAQLLVIAREYALPSTIGIILYLVTPPPQTRQNSPMRLASPSCDAGGGEPGPRLSEEIWKHIWSRALRAERDEVMALSRSGTPNPIGLDLTVEPNALRPLVIPARPDQRPLAFPITPSTSTGSSLSDIRSHEKSAAHSEPNTPDTPPSSDHGLPGIELPGLRSHSIIPILAKVEFDIDTRTAAWYEPWVRSRHTKRTDSRSTYRSNSHSNSPTDKRAPFDLKLVQRMQKPPFLRSQHDDEQLEYAPLSDSPDPDLAVCTMGPDPLDDVFGTDADAWSEIHAESDDVRRKLSNLNVVELALDATSLAAPTEPCREESNDTDDVDEIRDIMRKMSHPPLTVEIPDSAPSNRRSSPLTAGGKRPLPPPLVLVPKSPPNNLVDGMADVMDFPDKEGLSLEMEREYQRSRSPGEEKRVGTLFEDLDLGLDLGDDDEEYDENDPNDRRRSQYLMKAKLDEIERTLAQFSPQELKTARLEDDSTTHRRNPSTPSRSHTPAESSSTSPLHNAWPSISYSSVVKTVNGSPLRHGSLPPSPPRLALNGVSTGAPKAFMPVSAVSSTVSTENLVRRLELDQAMYPVSTSSRQGNIALDSPIPLSPDPFGRHPSIYEVDAAPMQSYWDPVAQKFSHELVGPSSSVSSVDDGPGSLASATPSSRFSADSSGVADQSDRTAKSTAPLVSVKGLKKLWRRSKSSSNALPQPPTPGRTSFQLSNSPQPPTPVDQLMSLPLPGVMTRSSSGKAPVGQPQSDQISRPSLSGSRPNSPAVLLNAPQEKPSVRKSILKSWKSVTGTVPQPSTSTSESQKSSERPISNETIKPNRPSVLDGSIPPSPHLPDQFLASNHIRTGSNTLEHRKSPVRSKIGSGHHYSSASHDLLSAIPPAWSPVVMQTPGSASPFQTQFPAGASVSQAMGLETSQFEIISPPKPHPKLTYPYMTLDHE